MIRGKDYIAGLRGVVLECSTVGPWTPLCGSRGLVPRQTHRQGVLGWALARASISDREIEEETGMNGRTLERWMRMLRRQG
ncbi:MAG TPA: hypothetical protein VNV41_11275 [Candidatus Acidoferrales bacterium]|nr:hypothetical protein [Candidatus Acidoferrales bacterium]